MNSYTDPRFKPSELDRVIVRQALLHAVSTNLDHFHGTLIDVGCGHMPYKHLLTTYPSKVTRYIGLDVSHNRYQGAQADLLWDGQIIPLPDHSVDCALATEVLEHCPEPGEVLQEIARILKPGGVLVLTVPFLWPLHDVPNDEFRYTPFSLRRYLVNAGFDDILLSATGGWDASLGQMLGLWVRRRPMRRVVRRMMSVALLPIVQMLSALDRKPPAFTESQMITGLVGIAYRSRRT